MPTPLSALHALAITSQIATALAVPEETTSAVEAAPAPNFPEVFFAGYNNPDSSNTFHFINSDETVTFKPLSASQAAQTTASDQDNAIEKRQKSGPVPGANYCWDGPRLP